MTPDVQIFTPPHSPPAIIEQKLSSYAAEPIDVPSHGFRYVLTGNTLLSPDRLKAVLSSALDPKMAVADTLAAYRREGYYLVAVTAQFAGRSVPAVSGTQLSKADSPQIVNINVIEGRVTKKNVPAEFDRFFNITDRPDLTTEMVTRRAIIANQYAARDGERLQSSFSPAEQPGGSDLTVTASKIPGFKPLSGSLLLGNYGSRYASSYVTGGNVLYHPGGGAELSANYLAGLPYWSRDSRDSQYHSQGFGGSLITPWGTYGLSAQKTHYQLGRSSYPLNTTGDTASYAVSGSQLIYATERAQLRLTQGFAHVDNRTTVFGGGYTVVDQRYDYVTAGLNFSQSYSIGGLAGSFSANYAYNRGTSARSGTFLLSDAPTAATPLFHYSDLSLTAQQELPSGYLAQATVNGQWAQDTLPQQQQWVLGGLGNLTAYNAGIIVGDEGYAVRLSLQSPSKEYGPFRVTPNVFVERGEARYHFVPGPWQRITDAGLGFTVSTTSGTSFSALYAAPIRLEGVAPRSADASRATVFFVLQQSF